MVSQPGLADFTKGTTVQLTGFTEKKDLPLRNKLAVVHQYSSTDWVFVRVGHSTRVIQVHVVNLRRMPSSESRKELGTKVRASKPPDPLSDEAIKAEGEAAPAPPPVQPQIHAQASEAASAPPPVQPQIHAHANAAAAKSGTACSAHTAASNRSCKGCWRENACGAWGIFCPHGRQKSRCHTHPCKGSGWSSECTQNQKTGFSRLSTGPQGNPIYRPYI